jgi:hypothetical protein
VKILDSSEVAAVGNALVVAAKTFAECEQTAREAGNARLAEAFKLQREATDRLADIVAEYDGIALHNDNDMLRQTFSRYSRS